MFIQTKVLIVVVVGIWRQVHAQLSGTCLSETNVIHSNDLISGFQVDCSLKQLFSCEFDGSVDYNPGIIPYRDLCYELDGQIFWYDSHHECTNEYTGITNRYFWFQLPFCLGKSCTLNDFQGQQENVWKPNTIQENLPDTCYISYENRVSSPLSGTCAAESIVLHDATNELWPSFSVPETSGSTHDFQGSSNDYKAACLNLGGVLYTVEKVAVKCNLFVNDTISPYTSTLLNDAYCFGPSCSLSEVQEHINTFSDPSMALKIQEDNRFSFCNVTSDTATKVEVSSTIKPIPASPAPVPSPTVAPVVRPTSSPIRTTINPVIDPVGSSQPLPASIATLRPTVATSIESTQNPTLLVLLLPTPDKTTDHPNSASQNNSTTNDPPFRNSTAQGWAKININNNWTLPPPSPGITEVITLFPVNGEIFVNPSNGGSILYMPNVNFIGSDTFTIQQCRTTDNSPRDDEEDCELLMVIVEVMGTNASTSMESSTSNGLYGLAALGFIPIIIAWYYYYQKPHVGAMGHVSTGTTTHASNRTVVSGVVPNATGESVCSLHSDHPQGSIMTELSRGESNASSSSYVPIPPAVVDMSQHLEYKHQCDCNIPIANATVVSNGAGKKLQSE